MARALAYWKAWVRRRTTELGDAVLSGKLSEQDYRVKSARREELLAAEAELERLLKQDED